MGRLLWVLGGGLCGVALSENKKLVGEVLVSIAYMGKGAASSALEIQVQGTKLSDIPLLGSILQTLSTMKIERQILQQGVDQANSMSKEAVRQVSERMVQQPSNSGYARGGRIAWTGLCVLIPACGAYAIYDEPTRQKVVMYTNAAKADIIRCMDILQNDCKILYSKIVTEAPMLYGQTQREISRLTFLARDMSLQAQSYAQENGPKLLAIGRHVAREKVDMAAALAHKGAAAMRENVPKMYHQLKMKADLCYIRFISSVERIAARHGCHSEHTQLS